MSSNRHVGGQRNNDLSTNILGGAGRDLFAKAAVDQVQVASRNLDASKILVPKSDASRSKQSKARPSKSRGRVTSGLALASSPKEMPSDEHPEYPQLKAAGVRVQPRKAPSRSPPRAQRFAKIGSREREANKDLRDSVMRDSEVFGTRD